MQKTGKFVAELRSNHRQGRDCGGRLTLVGETVAEPMEQEHGDVAGDVDQHEGPQVGERLVHGALQQRPPRDASGGGGGGARRSRGACAVGLCWGGGRDFSLIVLLRQLRLPAALGPG